MDYKMMHIFRNTPFGRETFLQSLYFCRTVKVAPVVYIPKNDKFLFYFSNDVVQVDLDNDGTASEVSAVTVGFDMAVGSASKSSLGRRSTEAPAR